CALPIFWCLAAWTAIALFFSVRSSLYRAAEGQVLFPLSVLTSNFLSCWLWAFLTPQIWKLSNRFRFERPRDFAVHAFAALATIPIDALFEAWISRPITDRPPIQLWRIALAYSWVVL